MYSAFNALEAVGKALGEIKSSDRLTWADVGAVLGKNEDQAAKYAAGAAAMDVVTYGRARKAWGQRFTGPFERLCDESRAAELSDHSTLTALLDAAAAMSKALEDGRISTAEVLVHRAELEKANEAIATQLAKLTPCAAFGRNA